MEPFTLAWLEKRVRKDPDGCWIWLHATVNSGYGKLRKNGEWWLAHRYAYFICKGPIYPNHVVRHTCNERLCVNPEHLITGTYQDNLFDQIAAGHMKPPNGECKPIEYYRKFQR